MLIKESNNYIVSQPFDEIICIKAINKAKWSTIEIKELSKIANEFNRPKSYLLDIRNLKFVDINGFHNSTINSRGNNVCAMAIVIKEFSIGEVYSKLFVKLRKSTCPVMCVNSDDEAIKWLKSLNI